MNDPRRISEEDYFLEWCCGWEEFKISKGRTLIPRFEVSLKLANVKTEDRTLDIGCGRGEVVLHCAMKGAYSIGLDSSKVATKITKQAISQSGEESKKAAVLMADCTKLPFIDHLFDKVFMLDLWEHLFPSARKVTLLEILRILAPEGVLIVHTGPNKYWQSVHLLYHRLFRICEPYKNVEIPLQGHVSLPTFFNLKAQLKDGFNYKVALFEDFHNVRLILKIHSTVGHTNVQ